MKGFQFCVILLVVGRSIVSQPAEENVEALFAKILGEMNQNQNFAKTPQTQDSLVEFYFYGCKNKDKPHIVQFFPGNGLPSHDASKLLNLLDLKAGFKIMANSWREYVTSKSMQLIKDTYLKSGCYNIFVYNWFNNSNTDLYIQAANYTPTAGRHVAELIDILNNEEMASSTKIHLIGFGLGAHVMGYAARYCKHKVNRVTGLDPFRPAFDDPEIFRPLSMRDAKLVDAIHTSAPTVGFYYTVGIADFYPNVGEHPQPGCANFYCSHERAYQYFAESITTDVGFYGYECGSWESFINKDCVGDPVLMGEKIPEKINGVYYLHTNLVPPFAKGKTI